MITPEIETRLYKFLTHKIIETRGAFCHAVGGIEDHAHLAVSLPPTIKPSEWIGQIKGSSSYHINQLCGHNSLHWQHGYGIVTFGTKDMPWVVGYVENQKERHRTGKTVDRLERITDFEEEIDDDG